MQKYLLGLLGLLCFISVRAQQTAMLHGVVVETSDKGAFSPIPGAIVFWKGSSKAVSTDSNGVFKIPFTAQTKKLVVLATGYHPDTIFVSDTSSLKILLVSKSNLQEALVTYERKTTEISFIDPWKTTIMNEKELFKAACCNLSESFETNPSVDVAFSDAVTGAKQIQMLGLAGQYTQVGLEQVPGIRGIASNVGLAYIPGAWINSIQMAKGVSSVVNGFENIAGLINVELHEPDVKERALLNIYAGEGGRYEANAVVSSKPSPFFSHSILAHVNTTQLRMDRNEDGFMDNPIGNQYNLMYRFKVDPKKGWIFQGAIQALQDNRTGGQLAFERDNFKDNDTSLPYGIQSNSNRLYGFGKVGYVFPAKKYKSIGLQYNFVHQNNEQVFGITKYFANMNSNYLNLIYQSIIGNTNHKFRTGISFQQDQVHEKISAFRIMNSGITSMDGSLVHFQRNEMVSGAFFEYTYTHLTKFTLVGGLRTDYHHYFGWMLSPRMHARFAPNEKFVLRASAGRGWRTANVLAENSNVWVSNRTMRIWPQPTQLNSWPTYGFRPESAWNMGLNLTYDFKLNYRRGTFSADYYYTFFDNRVLIDRDYNASLAEVYATNSISNSFQVQVDYSPLRRLDVRLAYRYYRVEAAYYEAWRQEVLIAPHRGFINVAYETKGKWSFDATATLTGSKRLPSPETASVMHGWDANSPVFMLINTQVTKSFKKSLDIYLGCENIFNFRQTNAIVDGMRAFGPHFDAGLIWGPVFGRMIYGGLRWRI